MPYKFGDRFRFVGIDDDGDQILTDEGGHKFHLRDTRGTPVTRPAGTYYGDGPNELDVYSYLSQCKIYTFERLRKVE